MTPEALVFSLIWSDSARSLIDLALGFAVAGMLCSGYQLLTLQPASFGLLNEPERNRALAAVPSRNTCVLSPSTTTGAASR